MVERFEPESTAEPWKPAQSRHAAEASIGAAIASNVAGVPNAEQQPNRKKKKKKRNKNRSGRNAYSSDEALGPSASKLPETKPVTKPKAEKSEPDATDTTGEAAKTEEAKNTPNDAEGTLDLATPHEFEINVRANTGPVAATKKPEKADDSNDAKSTEEGKDEAEGEPKSESGYKSENTIEAEGKSVAEAEAETANEEQPYKATEAAGSFMAGWREKLASPRSQQQPEALSQERETEYAPPIPPGFEEFSHTFMGQEAADSAEAPAAYPGYYERLAQAQASETAAGPLPAAEALAEGAHATTGTTHSMETGRYSSDIPPGLQRSTSDVSRAALTGTLAGWFFGRRGKRKAVEKARKEATARQKQTIRSVSGMASAPRTPEQFQSPQLEATPLHRYPVEETSRTVVTPLSVETRSSNTASSAHKPADMERSRKTVASSGRPAAEARPSRLPEAGSMTNRPNGPEKPVSEMGRSELLKIAKSINIDGVKLKEVFAAKRIDQEGLRAVVETYLRGGDVKRQLTEEVVAKEQSFERDPLLRHQRPGRLNALASGVTGSARDLIQEHGSQLVASSQKSAKKATRVLASGAKQAQHEIIDNSNAMDWLSFTAIVIVWSLIVFLLFH
jgi:hypothetical protein